MNVFVFLIYFTTFLVLALTTLTQIKKICFSFLPFFHHFCFSKVLHCFSVYFHFYTLKRNPTFIVFWKYFLGSYTFFFFFFGKSVEWDQFIFDTLTFHHNFYKTDNFYIKISSNSSWLAFWKSYMVLSKEFQWALLS